MKKKTFLICPVRNISLEGTEKIKRIVKKLESIGYSVYWPYRDTNQDDDTGFRICCDNRNAIFNADVIHFIWDGKSQGCLFDLGIAFAFDKKIIPIEMPEQTIGKSFQNMIKEWVDVA